MIYGSESGNIRMVLTGDSLITRSLKPFREPQYLGLRRILRAADFRLTNVEMLFHNFEASPTHAPGGSYMRADPEVLADLSWIGVNAVCTANNHSYDYGENGLLVHLEHLNRSDLVHAGLGKDLGYARSAAYMETAGGRVALIGITTSGPQAMAAEYQWRDGPGRPGANMIRYRTEYTVDHETYEALLLLRNKFNLHVGERPVSHRFADHSYGASAIQDADDSFYMSSLNDRWQYPVPNGCIFRRGSGFERRLVAVESDVQEVLERIDDARRMADWVVVSMHNHEFGAAENSPAPMIEVFARQAIDAGADVFHGHGPHRDRGIEIYNGRPIFYSIGHFIIQNDTVDRVARENFVRQGLDPWVSTPADFYDSRSGRESEGDFHGSAANAAYWRDFVAIVEFQAGELAGVELQPIDLGFRRPRSQRGRPVIASKEVGDHVLNLLQELSEPYDTRIEVEGNVGRVAVK